MKAIVAFAIAVSSLGFLNTTHADKSPTVRACSSVHDWYHGYSARQICRRNGGSYCSLATSLGKGICRGAGASDCSSVDSTAEGICLALEGSYCSSAKNLAQGICKGLETECLSRLTNRDNSAWIQKLFDACKMNY